ncbi:helix-turn-helix transcriptional regulator [Lysinibacillus sp. 1 U-2021]|uniref:helix-turn-helix domain-containing protein n=1 Tax=Lysinibacillus sp. 1 U-2021 TaxID=3039426 RepID=UPI00247FD025|nr:helix-turn-helix transcriptional regulator [Lysinibacillus sp. 1 U-2021]WGT41448.1 helix-turn-helix transcriptional regulator [Lysinibacillus sp. 1 U-2021]
MEIGEFIREKRKENRLTLKQLATKIELSYTYLSQIELGDRNASPEILEKIAKVLDVPHFDLMKKAGYVHEKEGLEKVVSEYCSLLKEIDNLDLHIRSTQTFNLDTKVMLESLKKEKEELTKESAALKQEIDSLDQEGNTKEQISILERQVEVYKKLENIELHTSQLRQRLENDKAQELAFLEHKNRLSQAIKEQKIEIEKQLEISYTNAIERIKSQN